MSSEARQISRGRRVSRKLAMQALYQWQLGAAPWQDLYQQYAAEPEFSRADPPFFKAILSAVCPDAMALDAELTKYSDIEPARLDPIEHAILLIGFWELMQRPDVPFRVVINEAVELAKRFGATDGHKFVNAVLDKAARTLREAEHGSAA